MAGRTNRDFLTAHVVPAIAGGVIYLVIALATGASFGPAVGIAILVAVIAFVISLVVRRVAIARRGPRA